jgi:hypothetical protein
VEGGEGWGEVESRVELIANGVDVDGVEVRVGGEEGRDTEAAAWDLLWVEGEGREERWGKGGGGKERGQLPVGGGGWGGWRRAFVEDGERGDGGQKPNELGGRGSEEMGEEREGEDEVIMLEQGRGEEGVLMMWESWPMQELVLWG